MHLNPIEYYLAQGLELPDPEQILSEFMGIEWRLYNLHTPYTSRWILPFYDNSFALNNQALTRALQNFYQLPTLKLWDVGSSNPLFLCGADQVLKLYPQMNESSKREITYLSHFAKTGLQTVPCLQKTLKIKGHPIGILMKKVDAPNLWEYLIQQPRELEERSLALATSLAKTHQSLPHPIVGKTTQIPAPLLKNLPLPCPHQDFNMQGAHGDFHFGQVLFDQKNYTIIDWEGAPAPNPHWPEMSGLPIGDLAGLLRSVDYFSVMQLNTQASPLLLRKIALTYFSAKAGANTKDWVGLAYSLLARNLYEIDFETSSRPDMLWIPQNSYPQTLLFAQEILQDFC